MLCMSGSGFWPIDSRVKHNNLYTYRTQPIELDTAIDPLDPGKPETRVNLVALAAIDSAGARLQQVAQRPPTPRRMTIPRKFCEN
jgi:hypothetical protein